MIWQDLVLMIGGFVFSIALIPTIKSMSKPARSSCVITGTVLSIYCFVYATLGLWLALISGSLTAICWWILLLQRRN